MRALLLAARSLLRARWSTALQLATIAVGVGGVSAVFGVVTAVVLRPLPFERPAELVTLDVTSSKGFLISTSILNYRDWRDRARVFESFGGSAGWSFRLTRRGDTEIVDGRAVYGDLFRVLRVRPHLGRVFGAAETEPGTPPLAVIGYALWQRTFAGDSAIVGQSIDLGGTPHTVVGVLPPRFAFPLTETAIFVNMGSIAGLPWDDRRSSFGTRIYARVRSGVAPEVVRSDVARIGREVRDREGQDTAMPSVQSLQQFFVGERAKQLWLLLAAVGVVFVIALANTGGLVLARALDRRRDVAVRVALGGRARDVLAQFLRENVLLALAGGAIGLVIAVGLVRGLVPLLPADLPETLLARIAIDRWTVATTLAICLAAGLGFGVVAAAHAAPKRLLASIRGGSSAIVGSGQRARGALIVVETALSLMLAVTSGLLLTSFMRLHQSDKGFDAEGVLTARVAGSSRDFDSREKWLAHYDALLERTRALPGVSRAAMTLLMPLTERSWERSVQPEGASGTVEEGPSVLFNMVSEDYFAALGVPLLRGRAFTAGDHNGSVPVAIIDETMAERFWPGQDAIGKRVTIGDPGPDSTNIYRTVVGVAKNVRHYALAEPSRIQLYVPLRQTLARWGQALNIVLKTSAPAATLIAPLRNATASVNARVPIWSAMPVREYLDRSIAGERALGVITIWLAIIAAFVTGVGLFGNVSYAVVQRRRELALRMALGAVPSSVVARMTWSGVSMALVGVTIGIAASAALSGVMSAFLYGIGSLDARTYALSAAALVGLSALASLVPALAARTLAPASVLRED